MIFENISDFTEKVKAYLFIMTPTAFVVGLLYLIGYWSSFNLNILQYAGIFDLILPTAFPIVIGAIFIAIGMLLGEVSSGIASPTLVRSMPPPEELLPVLRRIKVPVLVIWYGFSTVIMVFGPIGKWNAFPMVAALSICPWLIFNEKIREIFPGKFGTFILFLLIFAPAWSYSKGILDAYEIKSGAVYDYVIIDGDGKKMEGDLKVEARHRLIGHVGEYDFFYIPGGGAIVIEKIKKDNVLGVQRYVRPAAIPSPSVWEWAWPDRLNQVF